jgi:meso-butanediol dehydrogenase / (S,S)-butanediol dehydrogenase / diacetyl reductase
MNQASNPAGSLKDRVAVVTGASKGIGVAIARRLSAEGAAVALLARRGSSLRELAGDLGPAATAFTCDVSDPDSVTETFKRIEGRYQSIDLLVNNAGLIGMSLLADASDDHVLGQVGTNLVGPILCSRAAIPLLQTSNGGHIINISSRSVELARPYLSVYSATKGGLEVFSRTLAAELRPQGIRVSCIRVGPVASGPDLQADVESGQAVVADWVARGGPPPEPPSRPESVADAVVFIATARPGARYPLIHLEPQ